MGQRQCSQLGQGPDCVKIDYIAFIKWSLHSFIHFGHIYSASSSPVLLRGAPDYSTDTVSEFHAEASQATVSEGPAQGPYVAARAGFEPGTLRSTGIDSTNVPSRLTDSCMRFALQIFKIIL